MSLTQTDIVMLLTPQIVRTHELTQQDVNPIYIGTQQNLGLGGPPPLIAPQGGDAGAGRNHAASGRTAAVATMPGTPARYPRPAWCRCRPHQRRRPRPRRRHDPGASRDAGNAAGGERDHAAGRRTAARRRRTTGQRGASGCHRPGHRVPVGGGPYTVPISVTSVPRMSTVSLTITYSPGLLRVRSVQEGSFMRQGGVNAELQPAGRRGGRPRGHDARPWAGSGRRLWHRAAGGACSSTPSHPAAAP